MGTTAEKLAYLKATKEAIKSALVEKGQTVEDTDTFRSYADKVRAIQGGGGASTDLVKYVTFIGADGTELYKMPVVVGDNCRNPVTYEYVSTPTKEPTVAIVYTYSGWSLTSGGSADSTALANVTEDRTVYVAFTESARMYTVNFYDGNILLKSEQVAYGGSTTFIPEKDGYKFTEWLPEPTNITGDTDCYAQWIESLELSDCSWETISQKSADGTAESLWSVGDTKAVTIDGTIGTITINETYYVYIIGFNHNENLEGRGITFGTFKKEKDSELVDVCLTDGIIGYASEGGKYFNMNHRGKPTSDSSVGGWAASDLRYDILGSTDVAPTEYGAKKTSSSIGYDATSTCATNPVPDTLMAALPEDLRNVMKPMVVYTSSTGIYGAETSVKATIDYLPLLSIFEVLGGNNGNEYEREKQSQYSYFLEGNSIAKRNRYGGANVPWHLRSVEYYYYFYAMKTSTYVFACDMSCGIAPIFKV